MNDLCRICRDPIELSEATFGSSHFHCVERLLATQEPRRETYGQLAPMCGLHPHFAK